MQIIYWQYFALTSPLTMGFSQPNRLWKRINSEYHHYVYLNKIIGNNSSLKITHTHKDHYNIYIIIVLNATRTMTTMESGVSYSHSYIYIPFNSILSIDELCIQCKRREQIPNNIILLLYLLCSRTSVIRISEEGLRDITFRERLIILWFMDTDKHAYMYMHYKNNKYII